MENGPFEDVFPIKKWWYSIAMLAYQRVYSHLWNLCFRVSSQEGYNLKECSKDLQDFSPSEKLEAMKGYPPEV